MGLVPHPVWLAELEAPVELKSGLREDIDRLLRGDDHSKRMMAVSAPPIQSVELLERENSRRLILNCDEQSLIVEMSLETRDITVSPSL